MGAHGGARSHNGRRRHRGKDGQQRSMLLEDTARPGPVLVQEEHRGGGRPVQRAGPVTYKGQDADRDDVEAGDAVVGAGEIDRGDGVGAAGSEEADILEDDGRRGDFGERHLLGVNGTVYDVREEKDGHIGGAGLRHGEKSEEFVQHAC